MGTYREVCHGSTEVCRGEVQKYVLWEVQEGSHKGSVEKYVMEEVQRSMPREV